MSLMTAHTAFFYVYLRVLCSSEVNELASCAVLMVTNKNLFQSNNLQLVVEYLNFLAFVYC